MSDVTSLLLDLLKVRPANDIIPVTPSDTVDIPLCDALLISVGGTIVVITAAGKTRTLTVPAGLIPLQVTRVLSSGTSATGISALYN